MSNSKALSVELSKTSSHERGALAKLYSERVTSVAVLIITVLVISNYGIHNMMLTN